MRLTWGTHAVIAKGTYKAIQTVLCVSIAYTLRAIPTPASSATSPLLVAGTMFTHNSLIMGVSPRQCRNGQAGTRTLSHPVDMNIAICACLHPKVAFSSAYGPRIQDPEKFGFLFFRLLFNSVV